MTHLEGVACHQLSKVIREFIGSRNAGALEKNGNDGYVSRQCRGDLNADEVARIIEATLAGVVLRVEPARSNQGQQHIALGNLFLQDLGKLCSKRNGINVHEQKVSAKLPLQPVMNSAGVASGIVAAIGDEDPPEHSLGDRELYIVEIARATWRGNHCPGAPVYSYCEPIRAQGSGIRDQGSGIRDQGENMKAVRAWFMRLFGVFGSIKSERELSAEIESHLQLHVDDNIRAGMTPVEARRRAVIALGSVEGTKEAYRDRRGLPAIESLVRDVRYGIRTLIKSPGFAVAGIVILGLGIGVNTAIFTVVNAVVLRPLPFADADRIMRIWHTPPQDVFTTPVFALSPANFIDWEAQNDFLRVDGDLSRRAPHAHRAGRAGCDSRHDGIRKLPADLRRVADHRPRLHYRRRQRGRPAPGHPQRSLLADAFRIRSRGPRQDVGPGSRSARRDWRRPSAVDRRRHAGVAAAAMDGGYTGRAGAITTTAASPG